MNIPKLSPLKKIRENCLDCCGNQYSSVRLCPLTDCPLWFLRFGKMPQTIIKNGVAEEEELFNPENFKEGGMFGPEKDLSSLMPRKRPHSQ